MADGSLDFTIPSSFESAGGGRPTIAGEASPASYVVIETDRAQLWILNGRGAPSARCHAAGGSDANLTTLEAFDEWAGLDAGLTTSSPVSLDIGGHAAHRIDVTAGDQCDQPWNDMQPMNLRAGGHDRVWAIQLDDRLVLLQLVNNNPPLAELTPELLAAADELVGSMALEMAP
jgi:hypothetical protein